MRELHSSLHTPLLHIGNNVIIGSIRMAYQTNKLGA